MKVEITSKHDNHILNRKEINFTVKDAQATPSRKELREKIAALAGADEKTLVIDVLKTSYGTTQVLGVARVYKTEKDLRATELRQIVERNLGRPEKAKPLETAAPEPKPEKKK